jgi:hypothetical protein
VFALQKLRIYVFGREITLCTDNKALSFIHSCALTAGRISRWVLQLQECDLRVKHISGAWNFLADTIFRNPAGMSEKEINGLTRPRGIVIYYRLTTIQVGWYFIYRYIFVLFSNSKAASSKI